MSAFDYQNEKVAVLLGGKSAEREVSIMSGQGVLAALRSLGVNAQAFDPAERDLSELKPHGFTRCFIALHGRFGEDGTVQGALELQGIPYTGAGVLASSLAIDKIMTKRLWRADALATPDWHLASSAADVRRAWDQLSQKSAAMIVKPAREGSTLGLSKVNCAAQCESAYALAAALDKQVLCEQFIQGEEVTIAVLGSGQQARALPLIRIEAANGNYDYQAKYFSSSTRYLIPASLPTGEEAAIQELSLRAYRSLNCRGWGRLDVMIDAATRVPYLIELNTSPGMTSHSLVPMAAAAVGIEYAQLCLQVLASASLDNTAA